MNYKTVLIELFAAIASYLIITIPVARAQATSVWVSTTSSVEIPELLNVTAEFIETGMGNYNVNLTVENRTQDVVLERVYLYKCEDLSPKDCVDSRTPVSYDVVNNSIEFEFFWDETLYDRIDVGVYPQVANILVFAKVLKNGETWVGSWNNITRNCQGPICQDGSFAFTHSSPNLQRLDFPITTPAVQDDTKGFITNRGMIPFSWASPSGAQLTGADELQGVVSESPPDFGTESYTGYIIYPSDIDKKYSFIFGNVSGEIKNPITLNLNPDFVCGNGNCESAAESAECCFDCGCGSGFYCDIGGICRNEDLIDLVYVSPSSPSVANCNVDHTINLMVKVEHPPTDMSIPPDGQSYILDGGDPVSFSCEKQAGNVYKCPVIVPGLGDDCVPGRFVLEPNSIMFDITYTDNKVSKTETLTADFPPVTIASWVCGDGRCDDRLGEDYENCCYDCGCSHFELDNGDMVDVGANDYCDIKTAAEPITGYCRRMLSDSNLNPFPVPSPAFFMPHNLAGDTVTVLASITEKPNGTVSVGGEACEIGCQSSGGLCAAACSVSCSTGTVTDEVYNMDCSMIFWITGGYDKHKSYSLDTNISLSIVYNNGTGQINQELKNGFTITVGASYCGDGQCAGDETSDSCCRDCPCPSGQYCDALDRTTPSETDECKPLDAVDLVVDSISPEQPIVFDDNTDGSDTEQHEVEINVSVSNQPSGVLLDSYSCALGGDAWSDVAACSGSCDITCEETDSGEYSCYLTVGEMYYEICPLFDLDTNTITIPDSTIDFKITFNNGSSPGYKDFTVDLGEIKLNLNPVCGDHTCSRFLGEDAESCCIDCPCWKDFTENHVCVPGLNDPNSTCVHTDEIALKVTTPDPVTCWIWPPPLDDTCYIAAEDPTRYMGLPPIPGQEDVNPGSIAFDAQLTNAPEMMYPTSMYWEIEGESCDMGDSETCDISCSPEPEDQNEIWQCQAQYPGITGGGTLSEETVTKNFNLTFNLVYWVDSTEMEINRTAESQFTIKIKKSDALQDTEEEIESLEDTKDKLENIESAIEVTLGVVGALIVIAWIGCIPIPCGSENSGSKSLLCSFCKRAPCATAIGACIGGTLLPILAQLKTQIAQLGAQIDALNNAEDSASMADSMEGMEDTLVLTAIGAVLGTIACVFMVPACKICGPVHCTGCPDCAECFHCEPASGTQGQPPPAPDGSAYV